MKEITKEEAYKHEYKMYSIVLRQLNGINNGVQTTHGVCEYVWKHIGEPDLNKWISEDKTLVILNGGSTKDMDEIKSILVENNITFETFEEEDLGGLTTSICLLADERVWNQKDYPKFENFADFVREQLYPNDPVTYTLALADPDGLELMRAFEKYVGGKDNVIKKQILNNLRTI